MENTCNVTETKIDRSSLPRENQIRKLGFEWDKTYNHDQFHTNRYRNGVLMVEFTYEGDTLNTVDLTIDEVFCKPITLDELKAITPVLGQCHEK